MRKYLWKIFIGIGVILLILPFASGIYRMSIEQWKLWDWLVMYSFIYWPTYVVGVVLIVTGAILWRKKKTEKHCKKDIGGYHDE